MFGMMFGDIGHGLVLVLGGLALVWRGRTEQMRDAGVLLAFAGGASILFGFLYGELFGFEIHALTLWTNPLHGKVTHVLIAAVGYGVIVISLGLVLNMVNRFRRGDVLGGFLDKFGAAGAVLYWGALAIGLNAWLRDAEIGTVWYVLLIGVPLVAMFLKEPIQHVLASRAGRKTHAANLFEAIFESAVEVFEALMGYMANTISFVRLAAYAMSHAALLAAALGMGEVIQKMAGEGLGGVLSVLVIIAFNLLAILLEGIIAAVQALRLQYYEFFGKFFSGTGRAFVPFRLRGQGGK
jgi:V/A-type H+-transporting ATPase subunit I